MAEETLVKGVASANVRYCYHDCLYKGAETKGGKSLKMVRCCFCMNWFHEKCIKDKNDTIETIWNCYTCRNMPMQIMCLMQTVDKLAQRLEDVKEAHEQTRAESVALKCEIGELKSKLDNLGAPSYSSAVQNKHAAPPPAKSTLLIGDSMIRDVDEKKLINTSVTCLPGATAKRVKEELDKMESTRHHKKIVIVAGTNDCAQEGMSVAETIESFTHLLETASNKADEVVVSSVCPRLDSPQNEEHFVSFNIGLQSLCEDKECVFVDHSSTFTLADGSVNEGFLINKGPHLTCAGTNRLVKNLKLDASGDDVAIRRHTQRSLPHQRGFQQNGHAATSCQRGCYKCGENNHSSKNCRHEQPVVCRSCNKKGHKAKFCRQY